MLVSRIFAVVATGVAMVAAQDTVTMTSTLTNMVTITRCNPTFTDCPAHNSTSSTAIYPMTNTTIPAQPTAPHSSQPAPPVVTKITTTAVNAPSPAPPATTTGVRVSGGAALIYQSGLLLGAVGAGIAFLA